MNPIALNNESYQTNYPESIGYRESRLVDLSRGIKDLIEQVDFVDRVTGNHDPVPQAFFSNTEFLSADEKRAVLYDWKKFIKNGYSLTCFTDRLYQHLHLHCGYIAHYNRRGFYDTYWRDNVLEYARQNSLTIRAVPGTFYNWTSFFVQFQIWGDYFDINVSMMFLLRTKLLELKQELENEVVSLFQKDVDHRSQLAIDKKEYIKKRIETLNDEIRNLQLQSDRLTPDTFIDDRIEKFRSLFPSMDTQCFTVKGLVGNLF